MNGRKGRNKEGTAYELVNGGEFFFCSKERAGHEINYARSLKDTTSGSGICTEGKKEAIEIYKAF